MADNVFNSTGLKKLDLSLGEPNSLTSLKHHLAQLRSHSITTGSPFFMNQLFSGVMPQMQLAEELLAETRTTMATFEASPAFSEIEATVIQSLGEVIGWPEKSRDGVCVPGGSAANFMAVHLARQKILPPLKNTGMTGEKFKIFVSAEAHYSFKKACGALGLGTDNLVAVPVDADGCMNTTDLQRLIDVHTTSDSRPLAVCATAGTTVLGAFDPLAEISAICKKNKIWFHVDCAWGGPALFTNQLRPLVAGIEGADSVTFDAHKLFGASLTCSFFLTKHQGLLLEANDVSGGDYLFHSDDEGLDRGKLAWQCGRRADAVSFWTIWKSLGTKGLGDFIDRLLTVREQTLLWVKTQPRLELVANPQFLNVCVRVQPPGPSVENKTWSRYVRETLKEKNLAMVNYSTDQNGDFLRLILAHPQLEFQHVQQILQWALEVE